MKCAFKCRANEGSKSAAEREVRSSSREAKENRFLIEFDYHYSFSSLAARTRRALLPPTHPARIRFPFGIRIAEINPAIKLSTFDSDESEKSPVIT